jgi:membrane protein DedA with SNARE-associated domain
MGGVLDWLAGLPPVALYAALALAAAVENFFPPVPADTVVAFGAFLAARGDATLAGAFLSTWAGNVGGAMTVFFLARRLGSVWLAKRLQRFGGEARRERLEAMYRSRGAVGLFLSRFVPGLRALAPPMAGALKLPVRRTALIIGVASALWYGTISLLAYHLGARWEDVQSRVTSFSRWTAIAAGAAVLVAIGVWLVRRRKRTADDRE